MVVPDLGTASYLACTMASNMKRNENQSFFKIASAAFNILDKNGFLFLCCLCKK